jgi:hypothetical protein
MNTELICNTPSAMPSVPSRQSRRNAESTNGQAQDAVLILQPHASNLLFSQRNDAFIQRPRFEELPLKPGDPKGSAWGLWGPSDELGTLNHLTPETVRQAATEITTGQIVPLNLPMKSPLKPMNPRRKPCEHLIITKGYANDDELNFNTQGSSHWDGLRHYPYQGDQAGRFYNGFTQEDISGTRANGKIGIQGQTPFPRT